MFKHISSSASIPIPTEKTESALNLTNWSVVGPTNSTSCAEKKMGMIWKIGNKLNQKYSLEAIEAA
jgi:hypothetical protein